jgi:hypothetical protein
MFCYSKSSICTNSPQRGQRLRQGSRPDFFRLSQPFSRLSFECVLCLGILDVVACRVLLVVVLQCGSCLVLVQLLEFFFLMEDGKEFGGKHPPPPPGYRLPFLRTILE